MELSIIIISYNTKELTLDAVKSVLRDRSVERKEIIIVDNHSSDGSQGEIKKLSQKHKNVKGIFNSKNLGFSRANNQGINIAKGKYILLLNSDTVIKKGVLYKSLKFADSREGVGVVGAKLLNPDGTLQESCFNLPTIKRAVMQYWLRKSSSLNKYSPKSEKPVRVEAVVGAAMLLSPQAISRVGGLDERYFFFYEDLDYCRKVRKAGLSVYYLPSFEVVHYHGSSGKKLKNEDDQWRRLIPGSKIYHGTIKHYIFNFILWSGQKINR